MKNFFIVGLLISIKHLKMSQFLFCFEHNLRDVEILLDNSSL